MAEGAHTEAGEDQVLSAPRFVGRDRELAALEGALGTAPALVLLEGEAGIGKTRLLREFLTTRTGQERGRPVLVGACPELRVPYTLGAVVDAVREGVDNVASLPLSGLAGALRPLFPEWADDLPPAPEPLKDATSARHRLFRAIVELLARLDIGVLVIEDVHWADEATLEFLLFLVSRRPQTVSVVLTYRRDEVPPGSLLLRLTSRPPADAHLVRLALEPLDVEDTASLVSSMLTGHSVSHEFAAFLHERTEGVPLAVEESVRLMHDRADLVRKDGGWTRRRLERIEVPPTIRDAVLDRVGRVEPDTRTVLYAVSVLAGPTDQATLRAVTALPDDTFAAHAAEALCGGLLRELRLGQWAFRHSLACHAVYEAIPPEERRVMHLRAGRALEQWPLPPVAQLARHFRLAGDVEAACRYTEQAADLCVQSGDVATAALLMHSLVTTMSVPPEVLVRLVTEIQFQALSGSDPYSETIASLRRALDAAMPTPGQRALLRFQIGRLLMAAGDMEAGRAEILAAVPGLRPGLPEAARARLLPALPLGVARPVREHLRWLREAPSADTATTPLDRLQLSVERAFALVMLGEERGWEEARHIPDTVGDPREASIVAIGHANFAEAAVRWGRYEEARTRLATARSLAERHELLDYLDTIATSRAHLDWFTGNWSGLAERTAHLAAGEGVRLKDRCEAALVAGLILAATGEREAALERLDFAGRDDQQLIEATAASARLWLRDGDVDQALRLTDGLTEAVVDGGIWTRACDFTAVRVAALAAAGRHDDAVRLTDAFARALGDNDAPAALACLTQCRAVLAEADGHLPEAALLYERAAERWHTLPRPYDALLARERGAHCRLAGGDEGEREPALSTLADVRRALGELGARHDAERVARFLTEQGVSVRETRGPGRPGYGNRLSPRELEVARLLLEGRTNRQIADALVVSTQTVASQLRSAMRKLKVPTRTGLALRIVELGLLADSGAGMQGAGTRAGAGQPGARAGLPGDE